MFFSFSDSFVNGWRYSNGKVTGKLKLQSQNSYFDFKIKKMAALPVEVIEICSFYKVECCGGLVSYYEECNTIYVYSDEDMSGGSSDTGGYYDTETEKVFVELVKCARFLFLVEKVKKCTYFCISQCLL